jgi:hypothetical protein
VHGQGHLHFDSLPEGSRGRDRDFGETEKIGKVKGKGFIPRRMVEPLGRRVSLVATEPHPENIRTIAVRQKAGFQIAGIVRKTRCGLELPRCWHIQIEARFCAVCSSINLAAEMLHEIPMTAPRKVDHGAPMDASGRFGPFASISSGGRADPTTPQERAPKVLLASPPAPASGPVSPPQWRARAASGEAPASCRTTQSPRARLVRRWWRTHPTPASQAACSAVDQSTVLWPKSRCSAAASEIVSADR